MLYRAKNLGVKELDLIVGSWATHQIHSLGKKELIQFNNEILQQETPDLLKKLLGEVPINEEEKMLL